MQCSSRNVLVGSSGRSSPRLAEGSRTPRAPWGGHPSEMCCRETQGAGTRQEEQTSPWSDQWMGAWRAEGQDLSGQGQARPGSSMGLPSALLLSSLTHQPASSCWEAPGVSASRSPPWLRSHCDALWISDHHPTPALLCLGHTSHIQTLVSHLIMSKMMGKLRHTAPLQWCQTMPLPAE